MIPGDPPAFALAGSQRWLQLAVARHPALLRSALVEAGALDDADELEWTSPLASEAFAEPRDAGALRKAGISHLAHRRLEDFWPKRGPVWDGIARVGQRASVFVEAKAHVGEASSPPSRASLPSLERIQAALAEARAFYAPDSRADWHQVYYQYANRLAHLYLLRQLNRLDARLVFLNFLHAAEVRGPTERSDWHHATQAIHAQLGLPHDLSSFGVFHAYVDVRLLTETP